MDGAACLCALAAAVLFANTWHGEFVYDDSRAIVTNEDLRPASSWWDLWRHDFWGTPLDHAGSHQSWRPLCVLSFRLNFLWSGLDPVTYHWVNIGLHSLVTLCLTTLIRPLVRHPLARAFAGLAFAAHPIHCEAVASVVGRAELGAALHTLIALLAYRAHLVARNSTANDTANGAIQSKRRLVPPTPGALSQFIGRLNICCWCPDTSGAGNGCESGSSSSRRRGAGHRSVAPEDGGRRWSAVLLAASLAAASSALLWKETGMAAVPLCALLEWSDARSRRHRRRADVARQVYCYRNWALLGAVGAAQLAVRLYALGSTPWFAAADNPVAREPSLVTRTLTFLYLPAFNAGLLLWPAKLSFDWSMDAVPPIHRLDDARNAASFAFYATLFLIGKRAVRSERVALALALLVAPFLPASNLLFYVGFVVAERVLYLPSMGFCVLLGIGLDRLMASRRKSAKRNTLARSAAFVAAIVTLCLWSARTVQRNEDWTSEESLYRSGIGINPAKAYGNLAAILARQDRQVEAERAYRQALQHRPNMAETHFNLGLLLQSQKRHQEAAASYLQSIHYRPNFAAAHLNLAGLLDEMGRRDEAVHWLSVCSQLDGSGVRDPQAHRHRQTEALVRWGRIELDRGRPLTAVRLFKQAVARSPGNQQLQALYHALGDAYQSAGDFRESEHWFRTALEHAEVHRERAASSGAGHRRGGDEGGGDDDEKRPTPATPGQQTRQQSTSERVMAHLSYARFLAKNASRHDEAEQLLRQAQRLAPTDPVVYMHTGQFLLDASRTREAAESFVRAASLAPADFEAVFNAATTLREAQEFDRAELFYRKAVQLRPKDVTVYRNLGALLHIKGRWREAEDNYRLALQLVPDDWTTLTNLKRLHQLLASKAARQQQHQHQQQQHQQQAISANASSSSSSNKTSSNERSSD